MGRLRSCRSSAAVTAGKFPKDNAPVNPNSLARDASSERATGSLQAVDSIPLNTTSGSNELEPIRHEGSISSTLYDEKATSAYISDQNGKNATSHMEVPFVLTRASNLREITMEATETEPVAWGASEEGNGAFNLKAQMLPNVLVGSAALEIQDSQSALLGASIVIKTMEENPGRVEDCTDREVMHAIQPTAIQPTAIQPLDQGNTALRASPRQKSVLAPTTAAPQSPVQAEKRELQVEPKEEDTAVLYSLSSPSTLPVIPQDGIYIVEGVRDTMALSAFEPHISPAAAECQGLSRVANLERSVKKRKPSVKFGDDKRRKVKKEILEESNNLLSIPQSDSMEETITLTYPATVATQEMPISHSTPIVENPGTPSNPETTIERLTTQKQEHSAKQSDAGKREDNIGAATSQSSSKAKLKSPLKKPGGRKIKALRKRLETMRRNIAKKQSLLLHTATLLKQPVENNTKPDPRRRSSSAPAGRRIPRTLHSTGEQDESGFLPRNIRASSEVLLDVKLEVNKPRARGRSAPPLRFCSRNRENASPKEGGTEARDFVHPQLNPIARGRRACTEGAIPATTSPIVTQLPNSATTKLRRSTRKYKRYVGVREPRETPRPKLKRKWAVAISAQKKGCAEHVFRDGGSSGVDMDISDALDISDGDISIDEGGLPFDLLEKLERAEKRPRLELIQPKKSPAVIGHEKLKKRATKAQVKNEEGGDEGETEGLPYDSRYHPSAVSYNAEDKRWKVPASCNRCIQHRQFCDRNMPCLRCTLGHGHECKRGEGLFTAAKGKNCRRKSRKSASSVTVKKTSQREPQATYSSTSSSPEPEPDSTTETEFEAGSEPSAASPKVKIPKVKKECRVREPKTPKKRVSNAVTFRGDLDCVWVERPHPQAHKPMCIGDPEVWCTNRQELCESLPYFRSYQSGTYHSGGVMRGYLADGCAGPRDFMNGRVVISHSGGKSSTDEDGGRRLMSSQFETGTGIRDLINNLRGKWPMIIIMGDQCATSPSRIPHRYCIMDWFKVTAAWPERDLRTSHVRWMFRFEKLDSTKLGWWAPPTEEYHPSESIEMLKACCTNCREESPQVYEQGWMCLRPQCPNFWKLNGESPPDKLEYAHSFINCHTPWGPELELPPAPLRPPLATDRDNYYDGGDVARVYWKGMCCPQCGRLSCREFWAGWVCKNCEFTSSPPRTIFEADRLADPHRSVYTGPAIPSNIVQPGITWTRTVVDGMTCLIYYLKDCGTVAHILASEYQNKRPQCADWLFKEYQAPEMPFKRYPLKSHKVQGQLLTQQFSFNAGAPYKYIVAVDSTPFEESPRAVTRSLELIQERVKLVHPETEFNEILSVGYFEGQKMDYHDDGEQELGETVASISLGAPAKMRFRIKAKHMSSYKLWEPKNAPNEVKVESQVQQAVSVEEVQPEDNEGDEDPDEERARPSVTPAKKEIHKEPRVKLELRLNHGDVVVMKGREIQRIWEHAVQPIGLFRVAATARWINVPQQHPAGVPVKTEPSDGPMEIGLVERTAVLSLPEEPLISEGASASSPGLSSGISSSQHSTGTGITFPNSPEHPEPFGVGDVINDGAVPTAKTIRTDIENLNRYPDMVVKEEEKEEVLLSLEFTK